MAATCALYEDFLTLEHADSLFKRLYEEVEWQQEAFKIFGKHCNVPRLTAWFGDAGVCYRYTGIDHVAGGWPGYLAELRERVEHHCQQPFNFVILNRYDDGQQYMGWHRDQERGCKPDIASISLGATRRFKIADIEQHVAHELFLAHGSLLHFDGFLRHSLPATRKPSACRVNLTFRFVEQV
ncbi:MAG: alpha-ketoglutarate-dependent dioxygenase AlkB [Pseudomonadota bacterium]